jgi:hypothetical protein
MMNMFKKRALVLIGVISFLFQGVRADEGMWLPLYLKQLEGKMQQMGCKLTAEDIYSVNKASIKDAIVSFGGFCTGEIVSDKGLVFTNHHCGYDAIAELSTTQYNWLKDGFWASSHDKELRVEGLKVKILVRMEDVTAKVKGVEGKAAVIKQLETDAAKEGPGYEGKVKSFYYDNEYILMVYQVFTDIRLVGTPPESVGKFGGDTDNWMWPRHTGDFSIFRIYADANNNPAEYSPANKPYTPKHFLPISLKGVKQNDFSFIMGFPGRTQRYLTSDMVKKTVFTDYPTMASVMEKKLNVQKSFMDKDEAVKLQLAGDYASLANTWKYFLGNVYAAKTSDFIEKKQALEAEFNAWANSDADRRAKYGNLIADMKKVSEADPETDKVMSYLNFALFGSQLVGYGARYYQIGMMLGEGTEVNDMVKGALEKNKANLEKDFKNFNAPVDKAVFAGMLDIFMKDIPQSAWPKILTEGDLAKVKVKKGGNRVSAYTDLVYGGSIFADAGRMKAWLEKPSGKTLQADPGFKFVMSAIELYISASGKNEAASESFDALMTRWMAAIREFKTEMAFYPDANSTLRLTYGSVLPYDGRDAISYRHFTTYRGILEKEIPGDVEFDVPKKLRDLIVKKDFGRYAENGDLIVNFLSNNDITGGNSGSPVINGEGHLIGIAFDGNWDSMVGDLSYQKKVQRTISVDIRYVLWFIDKYAEADNLIKELKIIS